MGSRVNVCAINFLNNPAKFTDEFKLEITFEVFETLPDDLEWKLVYVGSGGSKEFDQELDSVLIGPTPEGKHKFTFTAPAPDSSKIPDQDVAEVSVLLLKLKYNDNEFLNLGWWVSNEYTDEELKVNPPSTPIVDKLLRTVKTDDIRITTYPIRWMNEEEQMPPQEEEIVDEADLLPLQDETNEGEDGIDEDEDEEEDQEEGEGEIDLEASASKDEERSDDEEEEGCEDAPAEHNDEPMDESTENGAEAQDAKETPIEETPKDAGEAILGDMTNE